MLQKPVITLPVKAMQRKFLTVMFSLLMLIPGCTFQPQDNQTEEIPLRMVFKADTLDRIEDRGSKFDLKEALDKSPVMMLWIAAGCSGCHDWTEMIRTSLDNGSLNSSTVSVISIHRWSNFESNEQVMEVFGVNNNDSYYTPWPIVVPNESDFIIDFVSGEKTGFSIYEGYGNPNTPTVQLIGQDGIKMWQSKSYWANHTLLDEAWEIAQQITR